MWSSQCTCGTGWSWETSLCVSRRHYVFSLYLVRRGGGVYVAYITSWPGLDATFIQLREKNNINQRDAERLHKPIITGIVCV